MKNGKNKLEKKEMFKLNKECYQVKELNIHHNKNINLYKNIHK